MKGDFEQATIAPLLLLPLAENCFKHGIGKNTSAIRINISYDGRNLFFITENQIALREKTDTEENGGLGIQNVEKRLKLIYPDRHSLDYHEKDGLFHLEMKVELTNNRG
jgi:LytS/YehU family sensor histidine kinase